MRLHRGSRMVGRQLEPLGASLQLPLPIPDLPGENLSTEPFPLPDGEVRVLDRLDRPSLDLVEGRPQGLVPPEHLAEAHLERRCMERPRETYCERDIVERASWRELIEEPEPLLGERERQFAVTSCGVDRGR